MLGPPPSANLSPGSAEPQGLSPRTGRNVSVGPTGVARARDEVAVPASAALQRTTLGVVVDVDDAETLVIAAAPLEVVHQRPREVPAHINAVGYRARHGVDVAVEVGDAVGIVD